MGLYLQLSGQYRIKDAYRCSYVYDADEHRSPGKLKVFYSVLKKNEITSILNFYKKWLDESVGEIITRVVDYDKKGCPEIKIKCRMENMIRLFEKLIILIILPPLDLQDDIKGAGHVAIEKLIKDIYKFLKIHEHCSEEILLEMV